MTSKNEKGYTLSGFYPPNIDEYESFDEWANAWSMGPFADSNYIWFDGDYTEKKARRYIHLAKLLCDPIKQAEVIKDLGGADDLEEE